MPARVHREGDVFVVDLAGNVAGNEALAVRAQLTNVIKQTGPEGQIIVKLDDVTNLDAVTLKALASAYIQLVLKGNGRFAIADAESDIKERLRQVGLLNRFEIYPDVETAMGRFAHRQERFDNLEDHVIVCGFGRVGRHVALEVATAGFECVVIEENADRIAEMRESARLYVEGDGTEDYILKEAGIDRAKAVITALSADEDNLLVCHTAHSLNADVTIVSRVNDETLADNFMKAGAKSIVSVYELAAKQMASQFTSG